MATLPQIQLNFNKRIKFSNDGGSLSSDTGIFLFPGFDEKLGFTDTLTKHLHLNDERSHWIHSNEKLFSQKIYQFIAGYFEDDAADNLTEDPVFTQVLKTSALASQPSLSRFWERFDKNSIVRLQQGNQELLEKYTIIESPM